jgi:very-short-patch-repair endonuclease
MGGFSVISILAGRQGVARGIFGRWAVSRADPVGVAVAPGLDEEAVRRAVDYFPKGAALAFVPARSEFAQAVRLAKILADEDPQRPIAVLVEVEAVVAAIADLLLDISLQYAIVGGFIPLNAEIAEALGWSRVPEGYRSIHDYILHMLIRHNRSIPASFVANRRVAGRSRQEYEIDLWCERLRLAIEVDGVQHFEPKQQQADERRDADLANAGIRTQRILASAVMADPTKVLSLVRQTVDARFKEIGE